MDCQKVLESSSFGKLLNLDLIAIYEQEHKSFTNNIKTHHLHFHYQDIIIRKTSFINMSTTEWLQLGIYRSGPVLIDYGRLRSTIQACKITPPTILFLGNENKTSTIRGLIGTRYRTPSSADTIYLYTNETLLLIEPGSAFVSCQSNVFLEKEHQNQNYSIYQLPLQMDIKHILVLLLSPFLDVVCIFASDFGGLSETAAYIRDWIQILQDNGGYPNNQLVLPMLLVFVDYSLILTGKPSIYDEAIITQIFLDMVTRAAGNISHSFRGIKIIVSGKPSKAIIQEAKVSQEYRRQNLFLFNAYHSIALFEKACQYLIKLQIIDFIKVSRQKYPILELSNYYKSFLSHINNEVDMLNHTIPHIASTILLHSTPPGSHGLLSILI